jgi:Domain of unknown function (DUF4381)
MEPLALKDIHLPEAITWWPPAPGWWALLLAIMLLLSGGVMLYRRLRRKTALKHAWRLLNQLKNTADQEPLATLTALSALLRRVAISRDHRDAVASLHGDAWLAYLDRGLPDAPFSSGIGRCLADAHYRHRLATDLDLATVFALCERWLKHQATVSKPIQR